MTLIVKKMRSGQVRRVYVCIC